MCPAPSGELCLFMDDDGIIIFYIDDIVLLCHPKASYAWL